jgi:hypothetical protein
MSIFERITAMIKPPAEQRLGTFSIVPQPIEIVPAEIKRLVAALNAGRSTYVQYRGTIYDIYQNCIDFDAQLRGLIEKRILATSGRKLEYVSASGEPIEAANKIIEAPRFDDFIRALVYYKVFWGMGCFVLKKTKWNDQELFDFATIPIKHIDPYEQMIRVTAFGEHAGDKSFKNRKDVVFVGAPDDFGLMLPASIQCIWKRACLNDWAQYSALAGTNFQTIKYRGKVPDQRMRDQIRNRIMSATPGVIDLPPDMDLQTENQTSVSQNQLFENKPEYHDEQLAKLILGQTMTSDDGSSKSQAEVHERQQETLFDADAKFVVDVLNYDFIEMHQAFGVNKPGRWQFVDNVTMRRQADIELDLKLKELGYNWTPEQIAKKYELDKPEAPAEIEQGDATPNPE